MVIFFFVGSTFVHTHKWINFLDALSYRLIILIALNYVCNPIFPQKAFKARIPHRVTAHLFVVPVLLKAVCVCACVCAIKMLKTPHIQLIWRGVGPWCIWGKGAIDVNLNRFPYNALLNSNGLWTISVSTSRLVFSSFIPLVLHGHMPHSWNDPVNRTHIQPVFDSVCAHKLGFALFFGFDMSARVCVCRCVPVCMFALCMWKLASGFLSVSDFVVIFFLFFSLLSLIQIAHTLEHTIERNERDEWTRRTIGKPSSDMKCREGIGSPCGFRKMNEMNEKWSRTMVSSTYTF